MTNPAEIARQLSEAQKRILRNKWYGSRGWRVAYFSPALCRLGVLHPSSSQVTPLGLSVCAILEEQKSA